MAPDQMSVCAHGLEQRFYHVTRASLQSLTTCRERTAWKLRREPRWLPRHGAQWLRMLVGPRMGQRLEQSTGVGMPWAAKDQPRGT